MAEFIRAEANWSDRDGIPQDCVNTAIGLGQWVGASFFV